MYPLAPSIALSAQPHRPHSARRSWLRGGWRVRLALAKACWLGGFALATSCTEADPTATSSPTPCRWQVAIANSCYAVEPPWADRCTTILADPDDPAAARTSCAAWASGATSVSGPCEFQRATRDVVVGGEPCNEESAALRAVDLESRADAVGMPCRTGDDCASAICAFGQYCTRPCGSDDACGELGPGACCVGGVDSAVCMERAECATVCGENAHPEGLPTRCICDDGYRVSDEGGRCVPVGTAALGERCTVSADCASGECFGDVATGRTWCTLACTDDLSCAPLGEAPGIDEVCCVDSSVGRRCAIDQYCSP